MTNEELENRLRALEAIVNQQAEDAKRREVNQLKWGVRILGLLVMTMGGWIWTQVSHIFDISGGVR